MAKELSKVYNPREVEQLAEKLWLDAGSYHTEPPSKGGKDSKPYTIVIPPPNVTGMLHMGHALNNTLQDVIIRFKRMQGFNTLWMPGTDHAGIATQSVVEKKLHSEHGKTRHDVGREGLVEMIWEWKQQYGDRILEQLKGIGASCDWQRTRFTLDDMCARAVRRTFYKLFSDKLIYKGKRLVNWDPHLQTAVADDEVVHKTVQGNFYYMKYPLSDGSREVMIATTRPETMLGDTAVAVNPKDERAEELIGKMIDLPLTGRKIPIIADDYVKRGEGTGFLKVTPAHDPNDYEIGLRHDLERINILTPEGYINENGGDFEGLDRFEARKRIVERLQDEGLLEKIEPREQEVGHSDRSGVIIEPYLSDQWFVSVAPLAAPAIEVLRERRLKFHPKRYESAYADWLEGIRDWCISRQLWWGHRIPIWSVELEVENPIENPDADPISDEIKSALSSKTGVSWLEFTEDLGEFAVQIFPDEEDPAKVRIDICIAEKDRTAEDLLEKHGFRRDPDVLDTWFSSALWPFSTLGWPEQTEELKFYYPTDLLITSRDIITLWVSRMVMMGLYNMGEVPFSDVFIHGKILDGNGETMSKSKGNGIDPLAIIEHYGADAMRFSLANMTTENQDMRMPVKQDEQGRNISSKFDIGRNFCNKLWNASRFAMMNLENISADEFDADKMDMTDRWILSRLEDTVCYVTDMLGEYKFSEPAGAIYRFFWNDLCDWYLEWGKPRMKDDSERPIFQNVLAFLLDNTLRLMHPFMPFITEGIFQTLAEYAPSRPLKGLVKRSGEELLIEAAWPGSELEQFRNPDIEQQINEVQTIVKSIREVRSQYNIAPKQKIKAGISAPESYQPLYEKCKELIVNLAGLESLEIAENIERQGTTATNVIGEIEVFVHGVIDPDAEKKRLEKQKQDLVKAAKGVEGRLSNESYVKNAPPAIVQDSRNKLAELKEQIEAVDKLLEEL
ncbi:Valine--tRNA ligase [Sedimentisphaera cyanobacteriorum]|uniref:Valine--tRNA ligase n=1 Tax=Sedimentisphaera cyanobacteriorum TaxID=1940790 RepID=A0A1Q2HRH9_9BACT|nr:valine--tRNA ligase [Sedimentisphaera cyanobacteriorum]AQQ10068.1 Valine--tRNA ligase [Sedimentisphaera cyanobacteriorum]